MDPDSLPPGDDCNYIGITRETNTLDEYVEYCYKWITCENPNVQGPGVQTRYRCIGIKNCKTIETITYDQWICESEQYCVGSNTIVSQVVVGHEIREVCDDCSPTEPCECPPPTVQISP